MDCPAQGELGLCAASGSLCGQILPSAERIGIRWFYRAGHEPEATAPERGLYVDKLLFLMLVSWNRAKNSEEVEKHSHDNRGPEWKR